MVKIILLTKAGLPFQRVVGIRLKWVISPATFEHNEGYLDIYLEGDEVPSEGVWLNGNGDAPVINVTPSTLDFGSPLLGCDTTTEIAIQNDGNVDLIIDDINIMASVPPDITINYGTLPDFPWVLAPNARIEFFANYVPLDTNDDLTTYDISSTDPLTPLFNATAEGSAVLSNERIQRWIQDSKLIVDIIWVIDNSGSMSVYQSMLGRTWPTLCRCSYLIRQIIKLPLSQPTRRNLLDKFLREAL
jgi:hypothetical protein